MTITRPPNTQKSNKKIWAIAGPAIVANSSAPLVGLVDTWVVGHLPGAVYLAAIGVGATIFSFLFWAFGFLRMSTTGLIAQAHGKNDTLQISKIILRSSLLGLVISGVILITQPFVYAAGIEALAPPTSTEAFVSDYFYIRIWAAPATLFVYSVTGYLLGTAQAKAALVIQLVLNISNGLLNLIFVLGFHMGVSGIALGSVLAEWLAGAIGFYLLIHRIGYAPFKQAICDKTTWRWLSLKKLFTANTLIFFRTLILMAALSLITRSAAGLGEAALAANQILMTFLLVFSLGLDAFAHAAEAYVGAAVGRQSKDEMRFWVIRTSLWAGAVAVIYSVAFLFFGEALINTLTNIESVRVATGPVLPVIALMPIFAVWCYQFDGVYIGATASAGMLTTMATAFLIYISILPWLTATYGLAGLWLAVVIFMSARGLGQILYYPWIEKRITATSNRFD